MPSARVELTGKHLRDGKARRSTYCPVALACRDAGVPDPGVRADGTIMVSASANSAGQRRVEARMSPEDSSKVRAAVLAVDLGFPDVVEPFRFRLEWD